MAFICENSDYAPFIIFGMIMLTGFSLPVSEDLLLLSAGALTSTCEHETRQIFQLYAVVYLACWWAAWIAYWIGRYFGPKLFALRWFHRLLTPERLGTIKSYIDRFGLLTFVIGRFIPGGRNALFMATGLTGMPFLRFILLDSVGCLLSSATLFYIGHLFGNNISTIIVTVRAYEKALWLSIVLLSLAGAGIYALRRYRERSYRT